jgi:hypothetical protein
MIIYDKLWSRQSVQRENSMNGKRAEIKGHEKSFSKKPCPVQRFLGMDSRFAKRCFLHRMRHLLLQELKKQVEEADKRVMP